MVSFLFFSITIRSLSKYLMSICLSDILEIAVDNMTEFLTLRDINNIGKTGIVYQKICESVLLPLCFFKKFGIPGFSSCSFTALDLQCAYLPREDCVLHHRRGQWEFYFMQDPRMIYQYQKPLSKNIFRRWWDRLWDPSTVLWRNEFLDASGKKKISDMIYYEVHLDSLDEFQNDNISIGFSSFVDFGTCLEREWHVGYTKHSIGFHPDDGHVYQEMVDFYRIGNSTKIKAGEVIGCGYLLDSHQMFLTRNGNLLFPYITVHEGHTPPLLLHPCIISSGPTVRYTIQWKPPFLYDVDRFRKMFDMGSK